MNKLHRILLPAALLLLPLGCKSSSSAAPIACTCGTPEADLQGCADARCLAGATNPDNPNCVCGKLSIPK